MFTLRLLTLLYKPLHTAFEKESDFNRFFLILFGQGVKKIIFAPAFRAKMFWSGSSVG